MDPATSAAANRRTPAFAIALALCALARPARADDSLVAFRTEGDAWTFEKVIESSVPPGAGLMIWRARTMARSTAAAARSSFPLMASVS